MMHWVRIGKVMQAHGLKGDLSVVLFSKEASWLDDVEEFALAAQDEGPFEVLKLQSAREFRDGLIIKADGIVDRTAAEKKKGLLFYLPEDLLVSSRGEEIFLREIAGFTVRTATEEVGVIENFSSNGPQDLLVVRRGDKLVEIPFIEAFLEKIDFESKTVLMNLPEGLWE